MGSIKLKQLLPGMVLAADVLDHNNRVLLGRGTTVNDKHIKTLKSWGIAEIQVRDSVKQEETVADAADPEFLKRAREEMRFLFRHTNPNDPVMKELFALCVERKVRLERGEKS